MLDAEFLRHWLLLTYIEANFSKKVDKTLARVGRGHYETLIAVNTTHRSICNLRASDSHYSLLKAFFERFLSDALVDVPDLVISMQGTNALPSLWSLTYVG